MNVRIGRFHRHFKALCTILVLALVLLISCANRTKVGSTNAEPTDTVLPFAADIVFASNREGNYDIYVLHTGTDELVQLTESAGNNNRPLWSPNGDHIAFFSDRDGNMDLYVMDADGHNPKNLGNNDNDILSSFSWSPDSTQIVFKLDGLSTVNVDNGGLVALTDNRLFVTNPVWSPDGSRIAYITSSSQEIYGLSIIELQTGQTIQLLA